MPCHEQPSPSERGSSTNSHSGGWTCRRFSTPLVTAPSCPEEHHKLVDVDGPVHILSVVSRDRVASGDSTALRPMIFWRIKETAPRWTHAEPQNVCINKINRETYVVLYYRYVPYENMFVTFVYQARIYPCIIFMICLTKQVEFKMTWLRWFAWMTRALSISCMTVAAAAWKMTLGVATNH